jgi:hypothetical protein
LDHYSTNTDFGKNNNSLTWDNIPISKKDDQNFIISSNKPTSSKENDNNNDTKSNNKLLVTISHCFNSTNRSLSSSTYQTSRDLVTICTKKPSWYLSCTPIYIKDNKFIYPC